MPKNKLSDLLPEIDRVIQAAVTPHATAVDTEGRFPKEAIDALAGGGWLGALSDPDVGGRGLGLEGAALVVERLARSCASTAMVVAMHYGGVAVLERFASREIRRAADEAHRRSFRGAARGGPHGAHSVCDRR